MVVSHDHRVAGLVWEWQWGFWEERGRESPGSECRAEGPDVRVYCRVARDASGQPDSRIIAEAAEHRDVQPQGTGPWPFAVVRTEGLGLKVRSTNLAEGVQLGALEPHAIAWVVCQADSGFSPGSTSSVWHRVKWSVQEPSIEFHVSEPSASGLAWAFGEYLVPVGHNGNVPQCM